jgi:hypothetical protein
VPTEVVELAQAGIPGATIGPQPAMTATAVFMAMLLALALDWSAFGADSWRDRMILVFGTPAVYCGWNDGPIDTWCVEKIRKGITWGLQHSGFLHFASVSVNAVIGMCSGLLFIYACFALMPKFLQRWVSRVKFVGRAASWQLPGGSPAKRINVKLWLIAIALGLFGDLARGWVGGPVVPMIQAGAHLTNWVLATAFGAA